MATVDLHLHTNCSDGAYGPAEVMDMAFAAGLRVVSVTDHDTVAGTALAGARAAELGLTFVTGVEISTRSAREQHILGYLFDPEHPAMVAMCDRFRQLRQLRIERVLAYLAGRGVHISRAAIAEVAPGDYVGRPHVAAAMVKAGYVENIEQAFTEYLADEGYYRIERPKPSAEEGITAIRASGGVAVLAHPHSLRLEGAALENAVGELVEMGLSGIECYYGTYEAARTEAYRRLAERYGLVVTGGSDFHGAAVKPTVAIGRGMDGLLNYNDEDVVQKLRAKREEHGI